MPKLPKYDRESIEQRRQYVKELMAQGFYNMEIVRALKMKGIEVDESTVRRDKKFIRKKITREIKKKPIQKILSDMEMQYDKIIRDAWSLYRRTDDKPMVKARALSIILNTIEKKSNILDNLGLIEKRMSIGLDREIKVILERGWENEGNGDKDKLQPPQIPEEVP